MSQFYNSKAAPTWELGRRDENDCAHAVFYPQYMTASRKCQYPRRLIARGMLRLALLAAGAAERLARAALRLECEA